MKIVTVIGARPQFIKASVVSHAIAARSGLTEVVVHTGQHFDDNMSGVFFEELGMRAPDHHLAIHGGGHGGMTGRMLASIEEILLAERPDWVMVYGDTNSTLAGALAAAKLHIPVAHVEAGLRSFNRRMPEEINRVLTDHVSTLLFAPTEIAVENLAREGVDSALVHQVGDVMYDVVLHYGARVDSGPLLDRFGLTAKSYVLATVHRAENTDQPEPLKIIVDALMTAGARTPVVWPVHPRTRTRLATVCDMEELGRAVRLVDPVGYLDMVRLERNAAVIATDSGGVQKEAFFHGVPCVTLRSETEWVELVTSGWNRLAPPRDARTVATAITNAIGSRGADVKPYGDGNTAVEIVRKLEAA